MKKFFSFLFFLIIFLGGLFLPDLIFGESSYQIKINENQFTLNYKGFVPCGKCLEIEGKINLDNIPKGISQLTKQYCIPFEKEEEEVNKIYLPCQFCHFFVMLDKIIDFILFRIVPVIAGGMIVIGGIMFYFGGINPDFLKRAKKLIITVMIGLFLIYGAYMIIGIFLFVFNVTQWTNLQEWANKGPFSIECPIEIK